MKVVHAIVAAALTVAVAACSSGAGTTPSPSAAATEVPSLAPSVSLSPSAAPASSAPAGTAYKIKKGDTLYGIAKRNGISLDALIAANPQLKNPDKLKIGEQIFIPAK